MAQASLSEPLLALRSISKEFPGTRALDGVNLTIGAGEVVALLGENGAGKSTLMKILSGVWPVGSYGGELYVKGKLAEFRNTRDAHRAGVAMIHQELAVFPELTVGEHLTLDVLPGFINWDELHKRCQTFLDTLHFGLLSETRVGDLSVGGRQLVEIARALYRNAKILVFDEPTSALTEKEVLRLYTVVDRLKAEGHGIVYITHRLDEVFRLADRMVVLRDGRNAGEMGAYEFDGTRKKRQEIEPKLISWMVGRAIQDIYPPRNSKIGDEILRVEKLSLTNPKGKRVLKNISFSLRRGEVLGLGGLLGAGRSETFEALFGFLGAAGPRGQGYSVEGNVWIHGKRVEVNSPREAIAVKMAFVSEDRKGNGLILNQSIRNNITLPGLVGGRREMAGGGGLLSFIRPESEEKSARHWMKELRVKAPGIEPAVGTLSGGNQQKVVLAKWLLTEPEVLYLDEPTRGIDVGAKVEIYGWIQRLAEQGLGVVVASSEMPELLGLCHRILVLREGHISAELPAATATQEDIMRAASL